MRARHDRARARAEAPPAGGARRPRSAPTSSASAAPRADEQRALGRELEAAAHESESDRRGARVSLKNVLAVALGILSAIGGFVDIGDLVFNTQAGATFGFQLLWVVVDRRRRDHRLLRDVRPGLGGLQAPGLRPRARAHRLRRGAGDADRLRDRQPHDLRGRGRRRRDLLPAALRPALPAPDPARGRRRSSSAAGCCRSSGSSASSATSGSACSCSPSRRSSSTPTGARSRTASCPAPTPAAACSVYLYFVVGLLGAAMTPYEVYFYSSGAVEDRWGLKDLELNNVTAIIGYALGGFLSFALMIVAAVLFLPQRDLARVPRHAGAGRRARARAGRAAARARRHPLRRRRRGRRDVLRRRLQPRPVLRLAVGQEGAARQPPRASRSRGWSSSRSRCSSS